MCVTKAKRSKNVDRINEEGIPYFTLSHLLLRVDTEKSHELRVKPKLYSYFSVFWGVASHRVVQKQEIK